ncbi:hypothetical protein [Halopiger djelfimassiliensis]|uniref:hypothetical protein n=1 Tax=Halopiger djelfimassiliensis TaxID=1293047 RepID=UPI0018A81669|nr:hypothetical protein [Halopiger djelfimassiliensis]
MQRPVTEEIECPHCRERTNVVVPHDDVELKPSRSVAAFGDYTTVTCPNGHEYWVYFC